MYQVKYINDPIIYELSEKLQSSSLFKTLIDETSETLFILTLFKDLFIELNTTGEVVLKDLSTNDIDTLYEGLYYFGYEQSIESLDKYVYNLEFRNAQKQVEEFILKYPGLITPDCLFKLNLTEEFFQSYYFDNNDHKFTTEIYDNKFLPNSFFKNNFSKCSKNHLENRAYLTEDFVEEFDLFGGPFITDCKELSEQFLEKHIDKIYMIDNVSEKFARKHLDKLNWSRIVFNKKISEKFFEDYYSEFKRRNLIENICMSETLPESFFERHKSDMTSNMSKVYICTNHNISELFFRRNPELIKWNSIFNNKNISEKFVRENIHRINWKSISNNPNMSIEFFEENINKLYWPDISYNKHIPESFFEKHLEILHWESIFANPNISEDFLQRHVHELPSFYFLNLISSNKVSEEFIYRNIHLINTNRKYYWYNSNLSLDFYEKYIHLVLNIYNISLYKIVDKCNKYKYKSWKKLNKSTS
jgi:hypothetical protein